MTNRSTPREGTGRREDLSRRAALGAGGAGALALLLAGCGREARLPAGTALVSDPGQLPFALTRQVPQLGSVVELPGVQYAVAAAELETSLPADQARAAGLEVPDGEDLERVLPARGELFLVAELDRRSPQHLPDAARPGTYIERVLLDDVEIARPGPSAPEVEGVRTVQILASVPEGVSPERIVLETELDGITQQLSLLDGSRVSSDIEHVYTPRPALAVADNWWQHADVDARVLLAGFLAAGSTEAVTPEGAWAAPDSLMVCLYVGNPPQRHEQSSTLRLLLPDGTAAVARGDHSRVFEAVEGGGEAWFEVPADLESATARVEVGLGGTVLGTEEIAVSVRRE